MEYLIAMNGGDGPNSYTKNSKFQAEALDQARDLLIKSIQENLTVQNSVNNSNTQVFRVADLGCSVGTNTFTCVQTIVETVQHKFKTLGLESNTPEFQVFFNDNFTNDFNTLFNALPSQRQYMAAGVPGSFYGRLFPKASMNFMHSSYSLHWLSKVPKEVNREGSQTWNKGSITYVGSCNEVVEAYRAQFFKDMDEFFRARSLELAKDGLVAIIMPCRPDGTHPSESVRMRNFNWLGYALYDMAKEGMVSEALVDSFNLPIFMPAPSEVKQVVSSIDHLSIEILEKLCYPIKRTPEFAQISSLHIRAKFEGILCKHFGSGIIDDLFARYTQKIDEFSKKQFYASAKDVEFLFLLVKRNGISQ